jgi:hypothetical protein
MSKSNLIGHGFKLYLLGSFQGNFIILQLLLLFV